jgi:hypothetical protein
VWDWVVGVFERIGAVSVYWLALALALKTAESASPRDEISSGSWAAKTRPPSARAVWD